MSVLRILSRKGDDRFSWSRPSLVHDTEEAAAVQEAERILAERIFGKQRAQGATAFRVAPGRLAERIDTFDLEADHILMIPKVIGG